MPDAGTSDIVRRAPRLAALIERSCDVPLDDNRAHGVLLGLAVGNALGLSVEGWSADAIRRNAPDGVREIDPRERRRPMDDDLSQAVDLAESLASAPDVSSDFAERLGRWRQANGRGIGLMTQKLIDQLGQHTHPHEASRRFWQAQGRPETQPNGGLMRCAPVALAHANDPAALIRVSAETCAVTHFAPAAQWSCIVVNTAIAILLHGGQPRCRELAEAALADGAPQQLGQWIAQIPPEIERRIEQERVSGHTYLAMQSALWCLDTDASLEAALIRIVSAGGDTDTNAAVAGAVLGARYGLSAIPQRWLDCIPERERIDAVAHSLLSGA